MGILAVGVFFFDFSRTVQCRAGVGEELELRTSKVDISERISRTSRAAWRFVFGSVVLDWGMAVAGCSLGVCHGVKVKVLTVITITA